MKSAIDKLAARHFVKVYQLSDNIPCGSGINFGGGRCFGMNIAYSKKHVLTLLFTNWKKFNDTKGKKPKKYDAKMDAKARAVNLQKDLEIQLETTRDPAEQRIIAARIENLKQLIRTITNIK